jgi:cyclophilin family peptidyl-prolyl cis-trans isomerase
MRVLTVLLMLVLLAGCTSEPAPGNQGDGKKKGEPAKAETMADFKVKFETSVGDFIVLVHPDWAPIGAAHFKMLVMNGYFDGCRFFRVAKGFVVQFGLNQDPTITRNYTLRRLQDDPVRTTNARGTIVYATAGPNTRTTQLFINLKDNGGLDGQGFAPFGEVIQGMDVVENINDEYGESPDQGRIQDEGGSYLEARYPRLDYIKKASIIP